MIRHVFLSIRVNEELKEKPWSGSDGKFLPQVLTKIKKTAVRTLKDKTCHCKFCLSVLVKTYQKRGTATKQGTEIAICMSRQFLSI